MKNILKISMFVAKMTCLVYETTFGSTTRLLIIPAAALMAFTLGCTEKPESDVKVRTETGIQAETESAIRTDTVEFPDGVSVRLENVDTEKSIRGVLAAAVGESDLPEGDMRTMFIEGMFENCAQGIVRMPLLGGVVVEVARLGNDIVYVRISKDGSEEGNEISYSYSVGSGEEKIVERKKFPDGTRQMIFHEQDGFFKPTYRIPFNAEGKSTYFETFVGGEFIVSEEQGDPATEKSESYETHETTNSDGSGKIKEESSKKPLADSADLSDRAPANQENDKFAKDEHDKAIEDGDKAIVLNPNNAVAYNNRGKAHYAKGNAHNNYLDRESRDYAIGFFDRAIEDFDKAIAFDPKNADFYINRGNAYRAKWDYDKAIEDYDKAIALNPNDAAAYNNRGNAYRFKGDYGKAIESYDKAIVLNPKNTDFYINRGASHSNYEKAIEDFDKAIALNPKLALAYSIRGSTYFFKGDYDKAIKDLKMALKIDPQDKNTADNLRTVQKEKEKAKKK